MRRIAVTAVVLSLIAVLAGFAVVHTATGGQEPAKERELEQLKRRLEKLRVVTNSIEQELREKARTLGRLREATLGDADVKITRDSVEIDVRLIEIEVYRDVLRALFEESVRARIELEMR